MGEIGRRNGSLWPQALHLTLDDFVIICNVVTILEPIFDVKKALSTSTSWVQDVIPLLILLRML